MPMIYCKRNFFKRSSEVLMTKDEWYRQLFERLDNSKFRSSFHLKQKDIDYINEKGCGRPVDDPA